MTVYEQLMAAIEFSWAKSLNVSVSYRSNWGNCSCGSYQIIRKDTLDGRLYNLTRHEFCGFHIEFLDCINMLEVPGRSYPEVSVHVAVRFPTNGSIHR